VGLYKEYLRLGLTYTNMSQELKQKGIYIRPDQEEWLEETGRNFSLWIRNKIDEEMQKDGYEVEK